MTNKLVPVGIARTRPRFDGNLRIDWVWVWVWGIPDFFDWVWGYGDEYIPAIIPVPAISPSSFKLLKYSQIIK